MGAGRGRVRSVAVTVAGLAAGVVLAAGCAGPPPAAQPECNPAPPPTASPAAVAYARAVAASYADRKELSDVIAAQDMLMYEDDIHRAAEIDRVFLAQVATIDFPPDAEPAAAAFVAAAKAEDVFLIQSSRVADWYSGHRAESDALRGARADASFRLRAVLGLPPSVCQLNTP